MVYRNLFLIVCNLEKIISGSQFTIGNVM